MKIEIGPVVAILTCENKKREIIIKVYAIINADSNIISADEIKNIKETVTQFIQNYLNKEAKKAKKLLTFLEKCHLLSIKKKVNGYNIISTGGSKNIKKIVTQLIQKYFANSVIK